VHPGEQRYSSLEFPTDFSFCGHASHTFLRDGDENIPFEVLRASLATIFTPNPGVRGKRRPVPLDQQNCASANLPRARAHVW
jgi:hypothetical protein